MHRSISENDKPSCREGLSFSGTPTDANGVRLVGRAEAMVAFFLRAPADLESVGRGGSTTITFVAKQLNHGLSLPTKQSGIDRRNLLAERDGYPCATLTLPLGFFCRLGDGSRCRQITASLSSLHERTVRPSRPAYPQHTQPNILLSVRPRKMPPRPRGLNADVAHAACSISSSYYVG